MCFRRLFFVVDGDRRGGGYFGGRNVSDLGRSSSELDVVVDNVVDIGSFGGFRIVIRDQVGDGVGDGDDDKRVVVVFGGG